MDETNMPRPRATELAAEQLAGNVAAAQQAAERLRGEAAAHTALIRAEAPEEATRRLGDAESEARRITDGAARDSTGADDLEPPSWVEPR
jgi:cell division septum initiation protein DivIVA